MSSQPAQEIRFCKSSDGARIAYATCGAGPTLVKAGNWVTHLELDWSNPVWRPWLALLSRRHRLIRYDLRGCGLSDRQIGNLTFDRLVDDLDAVIEAAKPGPLSLLGIAGGCAIAAAYAVRRPDRVARLVLYGGFTRGAVARSANAEQHEEAQTLLRLVELGGRKDDPAFRQLFTAQFIPDSTPEQSHAFNDLMRVSGSTKEAVRVLRILHEVDVRAIAAQVRCPTLVLHPAHNFRIPFEEGRALAALIPKARFAPLQSRNFIVLEQETAWSQFVSELDGFLSAPETATPSEPDLEVEHLTPRERDVLELVAQGLDNDHIAGRLGISEKTVRNHVSTILGKLGLQSRLQAIVRAREGGFGHKQT